LGVLIRER